MIASILLSAILCGILLYAWSEQRRVPLVAICTIVAVLAGLYLVWFPSHATVLAELVGIGRGADLVLYLWVLISLLILFNLHLKLRSQMELITELAREVALLRTELSRHDNQSSREGLLSSGKDRHDGRRGSGGKRPNQD
jgi:hypothetical protein